MPYDLNHVRVEELDWGRLFPFARIFGALRMALHPTKLMLALLLAVLLYLGGIGLDLVWGPHVLPGEVTQYREHAAAAYLDWRQAEAARGELAGPRAGVFATLLSEELDAFDRLIGSALQLQFGVTDFLTGGGSTGVIGALRDMVVTVPGWLASTYPGFTAVYILAAFLLLAILGGAICRHAALQACTDGGAGESASLVGCVEYAARHYVWYVLSPVIPLLLAVGLGLLLIALPSLLLFNVPVLDLLGGLLFGLMLGVGFVIALLLIGLLAGGGLMFPALAVEGSDSFDAANRAYGYVFGRPGRFLFYTAVMLVFGALCYLFVGVVVFVTLWATKAFMDMGVFGAVGDSGVSWVDLFMPDPRLGELIPPAATGEEVGWSSQLTGWMIRVWVKLLILGLPAFAVSYFFSAQTWVYLLLRRASDGTEFDEVYLDAQPAADEAATPDKVESQENDG